MKKKINILIFSMLFITSGYLLAKKPGAPVSAVPERAPRVIPQVLSYNCTFVNNASEEITLKFENKEEKIKLIANQSYTFTASSHLTQKVFIAPQHDHNQSENDNAVFVVGSLIFIPEGTVKVSVIDKLVKTVPMPSMKGHAPSVSSIAIYTYDLSY